LGQTLLRVSTGFGGAAGRPLRLRLQTSPPSLAKQVLADLAAVRPAGAVAAAGGPRALELAPAAFDAVLYIAADQRRSRSRRASPGRY
jgi:hypothetical protein